jgi:signal transduction histidine kinase
VRLREVILNLVDNAVKYTPYGGSVELTAEARNGHVVVSVSDTGPGIPTDVGERIFEPFYRVPGRTPMAGRSSTGLGLALTRRLVEAQGGRLSYESVEHQGTTFSFTLVPSPT